MDKKPMPMPFGKGPKGAAPKGKKPAPKPMPFGKKK